MPQTAEMKSAPAATRLVQANHVSKIFKRDTFEVKALDDVSIEIAEKEFLALMGPSGSGKTTLLNTLLARNLHGLKMSGRVLVDGIDLGTDITFVSGYVQQDELLMSTLTG